MTIFLEVTILKTVLIGTKGAGTENTYVKGAFVGWACAKSSCIGGASAVKHLEIGLQSFWILEVKLLSTWLEIGIGPCWLLLRLFQMLSRTTSIALIFKVEGARLKIRVGAGWLSWDPWVGWYLVSCNGFISSGFSPYKCCNQR